MGTEDEEVEWYYMSERQEQERKDLDQQHPSIPHKDILHVKTAEALSSQHSTLLAFLFQHYDSRADE